MPELRMSGARPVAADPAGAAKQSRARLGRVVLLMFVALGAIMMFFPFLWTVITSFSSGLGLSAKPRLIPEQPSLDAYRTLFLDLPFARVVFNSLAIAVVVTFAQVMTSALAAYVFTRMPFRGRGVVFALYLATMMIPGQVLLVPQFVIMKNLGLIDNYVGVIIPSIATAFGVFLVKQGMDAIPRELDEAAELDGASHFQTFLRIVLPNAGPSIATLAVFAFMGSWNNFLWPLVILRSEEKQTLPLALAGLQGQYTTDWDVMMAGSVISILPMLAIYIFAQKYVVRGIASSGIK
ncbi:MAG: carbohydrate ABC transporter permease [Demequina sp.]|nr:carbohydrate ABC transporter permease [Demequina sp.]